MKLDKNKSGFTLLEIIIVIIIVGVLASLAMPKFFKTVEYSRSTEALGSLGAIRRAMDVCYQPTRQYTPCNAFSVLSIEDPGTIAGAHWTYTIPATAANTYTIRATRTTVDGGNSVNDWIQINEQGAKTGNGNFAGIR